MERTEGECVRRLVGALLAVPAHMSRLDRDGIMPEGTVEPAHRALIGVRAQDLLGEPAAAGPHLNSAGDSLASGQVQGGHVKVDGADQLGQNRREA